MVIGVAGVAFLVGPAAASFSANPKCWGVPLRNWDAQDGRLVDPQRKTAAKAHPFMQGAVATVRNRTGVRDSGNDRGSDSLEHARCGAVIYLMIFGSIIGYSAYVYVMIRLPVAIAFHLLR